MSEFTRFNQPGFERWQRPRKHGETITIYQSGSIRLPGELLAAVGDPTHVVFLHDLAGKRIAFEPSNEENPDAYPLRTFKGGTTRMVSARAFLTSINQPLTGTYPAMVENGLIVAELAAPETTA